MEQDKAVSDEELVVDVVGGEASGSLGKEGPRRAVWRKQQVTQAPK